jgi:threonine dehydratase
MHKELTLSAMANSRTRLCDRIVTTPSLQWRSTDSSKSQGPDAAVFVKLELFQHTGTFKARGAIDRQTTQTESDCGITGRVRECQDLMRRIVEHQLSPSLTGKEVKEFQVTN